MMYPIHNRRVINLATLVGLIGLMVFGFRIKPIAIVESLAWSSNTPDPNSGQTANQPVTNQVMYLPEIFKDYPWPNPFGVEVTNFITGTLLTRAEDLRLGWMRINGRVSWRELQLNPGDPINWGLLANFENELRTLKAAGMTPIVIVNDSPHWATDNTVRIDRQPTSCGPLLTDKFGAYADFMRSLVVRYKTPEFNVHDWELGNEPDVDPNLVLPDSVFGCWGDINDPLYGGEHYGEMLKVVGPAIKAEDPSAHVWIGGLLLDRPETTDPQYGHPERFLRGVFEAGAATFVDVIPYHSYTGYQNQTIDYDNGNPLSAWYAWGGAVLGKARFLRQIMGDYQVDRPLFLNEIALNCPDYYPWCNPPGDSFNQMQADYVVRSLIRGNAENIMGYTWYTLDGPGWRYGGLLYDLDNPKPVYIAYQQLTLQLQYTKYIGSVNYNTGIEAYAFQRAGQQVYVVWTTTDQSLFITVPSSRFISAFTRDGAIILPTPIGSDYRFQVGFSPIYLVLKP
jgi:hypothetical protein